MDLGEFFSRGSLPPYNGAAVNLPEERLLKLVESNLNRIRFLSGGFQLSPTSKQLESWGIALPLPFSAQPTGDDSSAETERIRKLIESEVASPQHLSSTDYAIYAGVTGYAAGLFHISCALFGDAEDRIAGPAINLAVQCLREAIVLLRMIEPHVRASKPRNPGLGFYCGVSGYLTLRAAVEHAAYLYEEEVKAETEEETSAESFTSNGRRRPLNVAVGPTMHEPFALELLQMEEAVLPSDAPDELLFGRAGFLYNLAFLRKHRIAVDSGQAVQRVIQKLFSMGLEGAGPTEASNHAPRWPLMWKLFGSKYLGAAHGVAGIANVLLFWWDVLTEAQKGLLVGTIERLVEEAASGNCSVLDIEPGNQEPPEFLFHWCHGAPGITPLFCKAYLLTRSKRFLDAAEKCVSLIWERGRLRKGNGLCHGVMGNAYPFLSMYRSHPDQKYLYYALEFSSTVFGATPCVARPENSSSSPSALATDEDAACYRASVVSYADPQRQVPNCPDKPLSLMEGEMGVLCFLVDLLNPTRSHFPGFEL